MLIYSPASTLWTSRRVCDTLVWNIGKESWMSSFRTLEFPSLSLAQVQVATVNSSKVSSGYLLKCKRFLLDVLNSKCSPYAQNFTVPLNIKCDTNTMHWTEMRIQDTDKPHSSISYNRTCSGWMAFFSKQLVCGWEDTWRKLSKYMFTALLLDKWQLVKDLICNIATESQIQTT